MIAFSTALINHSENFQLKFKITCSENKCFVNKPKKYLHYTGGITPKRVTNGGVRLRGLAPGQHSSEELTQRWRHCFRFDRPGNRTPDLPYR